MLLLPEIQEVLKCNTCVTMIKIAIPLVEIIHFREEDITIDTT